MKFNWDGFTEIDFVDYCTRVENGTLYADEYVGCVRVGDLCFDIVLRDVDNLILTYDLYVGGVDSGYGYSNTGYPYDEADGGAFENTCIGMIYYDFKVYAEKEFVKYINGCKYVSANLVEKANEELNVW